MTSSPWTSRWRIDRAIAVRVARPLRTLWKASPEHRIPVLMYHSISNGSVARHPYFETHTSVAMFAIHMQCLREWGYRGVTLDEATKALDRPPQSNKMVAITFDDGFRDFYSDALPVLERCGFPATMYVVSSFVGTKHTHFEGKEFMTWSEVRDSQRRGIQIGSHTISHPELHSLSRGDIEREIVESRRAIEDHLGVPATSFSFPYAFPEQDRPFMASIRRILAEAGYQSGVSTIVGCAGPQDDPYFLPRLPVNTHDDRELFRAKLEGAYNWLHLPQYLSKEARHWLRH